MSEPNDPKPAREPIDATDMVDIGRVVVAKAKDGVMKAAEVAYKIRRYQPPEVRLDDLPPVSDAASLAEAHAKVIAAAAANRMTTRQALDFSTMLEYRRRAVGTYQIETKINELYAQKRKDPGSAR